MPCPFVLAATTRGLVKSAILHCNCIFSSGEVRGLDEGLDGGAGLEPAGLQLARSVSHRLLVLLQPFILQVALRQIIYGYTK